MLHYSNNITNEAGGRRHPGDPNRKGEYILTRFRILCLAISLKIFYFFVQHANLRNSQQSVAKV